MIVVDSSALVAIVLNEDDSNRFLAAMRTTEKVVISAVNVHETSIVLMTRRKDTGVKDLRTLLGTLHIEIVPFDEAQADAAAAAYARFGKGLGSKAQLNLCDCAAYALARSLDAPLLFKGEDFSQTDVRRCL